MLRMAGATKGNMSMIRKMARRPSDVIFVVSKDHVKPSL